VDREPARKPRPPLDREGLDRLALHHAGRYATTRHKFRAYLERKLKERGWEGPTDPDVEALVERFAELGYVNDAAFAAAKAGALHRRGYGDRRVAQALRGAGIEEEIAAQARVELSDGAWAAALRFAEKKRIGPYAAEPADRIAREKAIAAMLRAGHPFDTARRIAAAAPGEIPESDVI
jgi:regulatory protein